MKVAVLFQDPSDSFPGNAIRVVRAKTGQAVSFTVNEKTHFLAFEEEFKSYQEALLKTEAARKELALLVSAPLEVYVQVEGTQGFISRDDYIIMLETRARALERFLSSENDGGGAFDAHLEEDRPLEGTLSRENRHE